MSEENKDLTRKFFDEVYSQGKVDLLYEIMSPDYVAHGPGSEPFTLEAPGVRAQGLEAVTRSIVNKPPDITAVIDQQIAEGDTVVSRLTMSAGGRSWVALAIQRIENGKIVETWRIANNRAG